MAREKKNDRDTQAENAWQDLVDAAGEGAGSVGIYRKPPNNGPDDYLGSASVEETRHDPLEYLKERFGGGRYTIQLKDPAGKWVAGTRVHFKIAGPPKAEADEKSKEEEVARLERKLDELSAKGNGADTALLIELLRQLGEARSRPAPQGASVAEIIGAVTPLLAPLLAALLERKPDSSRLEELATLMQIARDMREPPPDGVGALVKTMGEPIAKLLTAHAEGNVGSPQAPASNGARPAPPTSEVGVQRPAWYGFLAGVVPQAVRWAAAGKDPQLRGDLVVDELEDEQLGPVKEVLTSPAFRDEFFRHFPAARDHVAWFDALFHRIVYNILDESEIAELEAAEAEESNELEEPSSSSMADEPDEAAAPASVAAPTGHVQLVDADTPS